MKEKAVGAIIFFNKENPEFLILHHGHKYWNFPKGKTEKGETELETALREIKEETGIEDLKIIEGFRKEYPYQFTRKGKSIEKISVFYLMEVQTKEVTISHEHKSFQWMPLQEALHKVKFENSKKILKDANNVIQQLSEVE